MNTKNTFDFNKLSEFTQQLISKEFVDFLQSRIDYSFETIRDDYNDYIEQAEFGLRLLSKLDLENKRILEIGSGIGVLTAWLLMNDADVIGIEPSALGFHFHQDVFTAIWDYFQLPKDKVFDKTAEEIEEDDLGKFDLIFSVNVIEHIPKENILLAFSKMANVLNEEGIMYHHCPNYTIPFEPHYGLPLVPFFPQLTGKLAGVNKEGLWCSVNFITLPQVRKIADTLKLDVLFEKGIMAESFRRLDYDVEFSKRHPALTKINGLLKLSGVIKTLESLPPSLCTPMTFILHKPANHLQIKGFI